MGNLRLGALEVGQKTAQIVVFVCSIAVVGMLIVSPSESHGPMFTLEPDSVQRFSSQASTDHDVQLAPTAEQLVPTVEQRLDPTATQYVAPTGTPRPTSTPGPTFTPAPRVPRVGIVAGHWWLDENGEQTLDVGSVCDEGAANQLTEVEVNLEVAHRVVFELDSAGYQTDLLQEWDDLLEGYQADVLVSIHADACLYPEASGFKVARVADSHLPEVEDRLVACIVERYGARTGLAFHEGSITPDMTRYHTFYEIDPNTPGVIIEIGFMLTDRALLTQRPDLVAQGIIDGILCFLEQEGTALE